ncbi:MAG: pitrilysin family protein [Synechococcales cyanobacterium]
MQLLVKPMPITEVVSLDVWIQVGAAHEPDHLLGMTHFLEHMIFKGTDSIPVGHLDRLVEECGGVMNAATSQDYTHFYITTTRQELTKILPLFAEMILAAGIPEQEFDREQRVVLEEVRRAADSPDHGLYEHLLRHLFPNHPYGRSVLGSLTSVLAISPREMRDYHRTGYRPSHTTVSIAGGITVDQAWQAVNDAFGHFRDPASTPSPPPDTAPLNWRPQRQQISHPRAESTRLYLAWRTVGTDHWQDAARLEALAMILGGGRTSRLVKRLREDLGWVRGIGCASPTQKAGGFFSVTAHLEPTYLERVEVVIQEEIAEVIEHGVTEQELQRVQRTLRHDLIFSAESPQQLASIFGFYHAMGGVDLLSHYWDAIASLTPTDISHLAARYLAPESLVTVLLPEPVAVLPSAS